MNFITSILLVTKVTSEYLPVLDHESLEGQAQLDLQPDKRCTVMTE